MAMTIAGDIYTLEERAKVQGYLASVWGISSVVGPTLGGVFSDTLIWRCIFFVNVPLCLLAGLDADPHLHKSRSTRRSAPAWTTPEPACSPPVRPAHPRLLEGGEAWAWASPDQHLALVVGVLVAFLVLVERRGSRTRPAAVGVPPPHPVPSSLVVPGVGALMIGLTSYLPPSWKASSAPGRSSPAWRSPR